jgi:hypothetical protein
MLVPVAKGVAFVNGFRWQSYVLVLFIIKSAARGSDRGRRVALLFICRKLVCDRWRGILDSKGTYPTWRVAFWAIEKTSDI